MFARIFFIAACVAFAAGETVNKCPEDSDYLPKSLLPIQLGWKWENRSAEVLPYQCNFVYGGGSNRLLYVGRVRNGKDIIPAAIHHYGKAGSETVRYVWNDEIVVEKQVEWLCAKTPIGWARVEDLSRKSLIKAGALPVGYDSSSRSLLFACIVHSFYSDIYPASVGIVRDSNCVFESNKQIVNSKDFNFWHTVEVLAHA